MPVVQLYDRYRAQLNTLTLDNALIADASVLLGQRPWMVPDKGDPAGTPWDGDIFHISGKRSIKYAFDRSEIANGYATALVTAGERNGGLGADTKAAKIQSDYVAAIERSATLRYASPIRCLMHTTARHKGHGDLSGNGVFGVMQTVIVNNLSAGYQE